jgi:two-component system sensor histidine kinase AlgZ
MPDYTTKLLLMNLKAEMNFLPDFCSVRMLLVVFFLAELLAFLLTLAADTSALGFLSEFGIRSLLALWIALMSAAALCWLGKSLARGSDFFAGLAAFSIIQLISVLVCWLVVDALPKANLLLPLVSPAHKTEFYWRTVGISSLVSLAVLRYLFVLHQWQRQVEAQAAASLDALQARMRPHFLFNSLNTIASLTRIQPVLAEELIEDLAELIRASMRVDQARLISVDEEIKLVNLYLAIEFHRLDERLKVSWDIDDLPRDALLPPLSLQPVVENAVYHGVEPDPKGGEIVIRGARGFGGIVLSVRNTLPPDGAYRQRKGNQVAMDNLAARIAGCFAGNGHVNRYRKEGSYYVDIMIPYQIKS